MEMHQVLDGTDALVHLDAAAEGAQAIADRDLLDVCAVRMAMLLGHGPTTDTAGTELLADLADWPSSGRWDDCQRAALAYTEHYLIDVASLPDDTVMSLGRHLGDARLADFVTALLVREQRMRLELIWENVL